MARRPRLGRPHACVALPGLLLVVGACGDGAPADPASALEARVRGILRDDGGPLVERLATEGVVLSEADLAAGDVLCPTVREPAPGDGATCRVTAAGLELEVDVEFGEADALEVVAVAVAP